MGSVSYMNTAIEEHIEAICKLQYIKPEVIQAKRYKVCLDTVNGAGGPAMQKLLQRLGCDIVPMNLDPTGIFAHKPEPIPEHLGDICNAVKEHKADLGMNDTQSCAHLDRYCSRPRR
jgi:phosphomannomutase